MAIWPSIVYPVLRYSPTDSLPGFCVLRLFVCHTATVISSVPCYPPSVCVFSLTLSQSSLTLPDLFDFFFLACSWTDQFGLPLSGFDLCTNQSLKPCIFSFVQFARNIPAACFQRPHLRNCDIMLITSEHHTSPRKLAKAALITTYPYPARKPKLGGLTWSLNT